VLAIALAEPLVAIDWTEADELAAQPPQPANLPSESIRH
jgi:ATP-dependent Lon protease